MAYIGQAPINGFHAKQQLTGDGSTVTFTLDQTVATETGIIVSVGGVLQEPSTAYDLAEGGTKITFTEAPASTDRVYIQFLGKAVVQNMFDVNGVEFINDKAFYGPEVSDYIDCGHDPIFTPDYPTISLSLNLHSFSTRPHILGKGGGSIGAYYIVVETSGALRLFYTKDGYGGWSAFSTGLTVDIDTDYLWTFTFDIDKIRFYLNGELYNSHTSTGVFSLLNNDWIQKPNPKIVSVDDNEISTKAKPYEFEIDNLDPYEDGLLYKIQNIKSRLKHLRQTGLETVGEYSIENLAFKSLRNSGHLEKLSDLEKDITLTQLTPTLDEQDFDGPFGKEHDYSDYGGPWGTGHHHKTDFKKGPGKTPTKGIGSGMDAEEDEDEKESQRKNSEPAFKPQIDPDLL